MEGRLDRGTLDGHIDQRSLSTIGRWSLRCSHPSVESCVCRRKSTQCPCCTQCQLEVAHGKCGFGQGHDRPHSTAAGSTVNYTHCSWRSVTDTFITARLEREGTSILQCICDVHISWFKTGDPNCYLSFAPAQIQNFGVHLKCFNISFSLVSLFNKIFSVF